MQNDILSHLHIVNELESRASYLTPPSSTRPLVPSLSITLIGTPKHISSLSGAPIRNNGLAQGDASVVGRNLMVSINLKTSLF